jgi:hypothetical protein
VDREWQRLDAAYQALVSPVPVAVQGSPERAVREIRQRQLADFNTAANAIKSSLAAPVSMLAYTVVQEARNGRLDAQDYRNLQRIGVAASGLGAAVGIAYAGRASKIDRTAFRTERQAYWKAEAQANPTKYNAEDLTRLQAGRPPIGPDGYPMELHHVDQTQRGGLSPKSRTDHRLGPNYKLNHP